MATEEDFVTFYERTKDQSLRAVVAAGADPYGAEDAVAEAFARAFAKWESIAKHPAPQGWVVATALNYRRSWWRRTRRESLRQDLPDTPGSCDASAFDQTLLRALRRLPTRQREVVVFRLLLDLDAAATAAALGIAPNTVGVHLHRALQTLRRELSADLLEVNHDSAR